MTTPSLTDLHMYQCSGDPYCVVYPVTALMKCVWGGYHGDIDLVSYGCHADPTGRRPHQLGWSNLITACNTVCISCFERSWNQALQLSDPYLYHYHGNTGLSMDDPIRKP